MILRTLGKPLTWSPPHAKSRMTQIQSLDVDGKHVTDNNAIAKTINDFFCDLLVRK